MDELNSSQVMKIFPGSLKFTRVDRDLGEGGTQGERGRRSLAVLKVISTLISIRGSFFVCFSQSLGEPFISLRLVHGYMKTFSGAELVGHTPHYWQ